MAEPLKWESAGVAATVLLEPSRLLPDYRNAQKERRRLRGRVSGPCASDVGAVSELRVCADLLARGFAVFRAVSPGAPCDLIVLVDGRSIRVEVKSAVWRPSKTRVGGSFQFDRYLNKGAFDVLALVSATHGVTYQPDLFTDTQPQLAEVR
jgi:hypothetical protein